MISFRAKLVVAVVAVILVELVLIYSAVAPQPHESAVAQPSASGHDHQGPAVIETLHAFDVADEKQIVGFADNVFVGRVEEKVGNKPMKGVVRADANSPEGPPAFMPETQFSVEVLDNIKGSLQGTVTVSQVGGDVDFQDAPVKIENDPIMRAGETVLFATRYDEKAGHHQVVSPKFGDVRIEGAAERARVVETFEAAKENQVDLSPELAE
jgi:hypothetical protein